MDEERESFNAQDEERESLNPNAAAGSCFSRKGGMREKKERGRVRMEHRMRRRRGGGVEGGGGGGGCKTE